jgi:hypothetical protein
VWRKPNNASIIEEAKVVPNIADTNQVILSGLVVDLETDDPVLFCSAAIYQDDRLIGGIETDFDGRFYYQLPQAQDTLSYILEFSYLGMNSLRIEDVRLALSDSVYLVVKLGKDENKEQYLGPYCPSWRVPLIEQDNTTSGQIFTSDQIRHSATRGNF